MHFVVRLTLLGRFRALMVQAGASISPFVLSAEGLPVKKYSSAVGGRVRILDIHEHAESLIGKMVTVCGWVRTKRSQAVLQFIELSDGSSVKTIQVVVAKGAQGYESLDSGASTGSSVTVTGVVSHSKGAKQAVEIKVSPDHAGSTASVLGLCDANSYPLAKKQHSLEFLRSILHLRPRTNLIAAAARVRSSLAFAVHEFFQGNGFKYIHTPIITTSDCEGAGELFQVTTLLDEKARVKNSCAQGNGSCSTTAAGTTHGSTAPEVAASEGPYAADFFGRAAFLTVSGQLDVENFCSALSDVYTFGPTFRAEPSKTTRHLAEFWMIEPELAFADLYDNMRCAEDFVKHCVNAVLTRNLADLEFLETMTKPDLVAGLKKIVTQDFARVSYTEAISILQTHVKEKKVTFQANEIFWGMDLQSEHERYITEKVMERPTFAYNYPRKLKAFYMKVNEANAEGAPGETVRAMDLLVPGIGELVGGSQREERAEVLEQSIRSFNLEPENYSRYMDLRRYGTMVHSGFGLGFERLVMFVTGIENIRDVIPFPRSTRLPLASSYMAALSRKTALRSEKYHGNIEKRGHATKTDKKSKYKVGPVLLGLFVFLVIGSAVVQIIVNSQRGTISD